jgi:hypothetical protein
MRRRSQSHRSGLGDAHCSGAHQLPWTDELHELRQSRARTVTAADNECRALERDLTDGEQQRLVGVRIQFAIAREFDADASAIRSELRPESSSRRGLTNCGCQLGT